MPKVVETFEQIAATYSKLKKLQDQRLAALSKGDTISAAQEKKYEKIRAELIDLMEGVHLNSNRIEGLVERLNDLNRRIMGLEGKLLRLAVSSKVKREEFLQNYFGYELDPNWLEMVSQRPGKGWKEFASKHATEINRIRKEISLVAEEAASRFPSSAESFRPCKRANARRPALRRR